MLQQLTGENFDRIYEILEASFPLDEYRTYEAQKELFGQKEYRIYGLVDEIGGELQAILSVWELDDLVFIEHFAVSPRYRNQGMGEKILQEILERFSGLICLEVELAENELAKRRIGFYQRNGFFFNDYPYMQPPICKGRKAIPLRIMSRGGTVSEKEFGRIRDQLYEKVYHKKSRQAYAEV